MSASLVSYYKVAPNENLLNLINLIESHKPSLVSNQSKVIRNIRGVKFALSSYISLLSSHTRRKESYSTNPC
jgi:hypothetical protein